MKVVSYVRRSYRLSSIVGSASIVELVGIREAVVYPTATELAIPVCVCVLKCMVIVHTTNKDQQEVGRLQTFIYMIIHSHPEIKPKK